MKQVAIIAEFNPFHNGHAFLLDQVASSFPNHDIVIVMSGNLVSRGECAILDKSIRARHAIQSGASLVVELPPPYNVQSGEKFAYGALKLISALKNCEVLAFGAETPDISLLSHFADLTDGSNSKFENALRAHLVGNSYPKALELSMNALGVDSTSMFLPNNNLAVSYLKAIKRLKLNIAPFAVQRIGKEENDTSVDGAYPSASAIRQSLANGSIPVDGLPNSALKDYEGLRLDDDKLLALIKYKLSTTDTLDNLYDCNVELASRIRAARDAHSYEELLQRIKCKNYTMLRIKRVLMYLLLDWTKERVSELEQLPTFANVLAYSDTRMLSSFDCPVVTRYGEAAKLDEVKSLYDEIVKLDNIAKSIR